MASRASRVPLRQQNIENDGFRAKKTLLAQTTARPVMRDLGNRVTRVPVANCPAKKLVSQSTIKKPSVKPAEVKGSKEYIPETVLSPTEEELQNLATAAFSLQLIGQIEDIDKDDGSNPQLVPEYVNDIYAYMRKIESEMCIRPNFMEGQQVTGKMRTVLVEWLIEVHYQFRLLQETLFMSIGLLDRFLQAERSTSRGRFQLVGVACLFVASKYEEMYAPEIKDFAYITDNSFRESDIRGMERLILRRTNFELGRPLPIHFLRRFSKAGSVDPLQHTLAKYLLELSLLNEDFSHYKPSFLAAMALLVSMIVFRDPAVPQESLWTPTLIFHSHFTYDKLEPAAKKMAKLLFAKNGKTEFVKQKYSSRKFLQVADVEELNSDAMKKWALD